jgi:hypothetical protein
MVSVARKLSTREERRQAKCNHFDQEITGTKVTNPKTDLSWSLGEDVGHRDNNNFLYCIQRYVSNDQVYGKLSGNND